MTKEIHEIFFELIQVAIGTRICLSHTPTANEWGELYSMAKKQSIVGICFAGVQKLTTSTVSTSKQEPPEMLYLTWMGMAAKIQQRNQDSALTQDRGYGSQGRIPCGLKKIRA